MKGESVVENSQVEYNTDSAEMQVPFRIDPEFENEIRPLRKDEFSQLRKNILTAGEVYEPLVVWNGVLVDGHHRWKVILEAKSEGKTIKFRVRYMDFVDKLAAFEYMHENQLGRRNLTDEEREVEIGKLYKVRKKRAGGQIGNTNAEKRTGQNDRIVSGRETKDGTAGIIGKQYGISEKNVRRAEKYADGIDALRSINQEAADKILSGETSVSKTKVMELSTAESDIIEAFAQAVNEGKKPERKPRKPKTEEEKRNLAEIEAIVADMRDPTTTPEFTIDYLIEDIELNGQAYVELLANTLADRKNLATDENKPLIVAAINKVVENILNVRDSI